MASAAVETTIEPGWLTARRERAAGLAGTLALPDPRTPGWEFTSLDGLELDAYPRAGGGDLAAVGRARALFAAPEGAVVVDQVDGAWSVPAGEPREGEAIVLALSEALARVPELVERHFGTIVAGDDAFGAHNEALWTGGVFVHVPRGVRVAAPVLATAVQATAGTALVRRTLIALEEGAEAEVWEQSLSADPDAEGLVNTVTEISVGANARLRYVCGQDLSEKSWVFGTQRAVVDRDGALDWVALGFGSARGKVRMETQLAGPGAHARVTGAYVGHGRQHLDYDTTQEHAAPSTTSDLAFRGLLDGRSTAVWRGMIFVDPGAQQTDAFQESRNMLLSKRAHADAIPGLEIQANDVRCTHAAAIAQIDPEQLFYLRSRGISEPQAKRLVIEGFLHELVERLAEGPVREAVGGALERRLEHVLGA